MRALRRYQSTVSAISAQQRTQGSAIAGTGALFLLFPGGTVGSALGGSLGGRYDRVRVSRWSSPLSIAALTPVIAMPVPSRLLFRVLPDPTAPGTRRTTPAPARGDA
ncbi:hypothetical protein ACFXAS_13800 [Streptomyces sp. NPDC059459]|uniref:hypothetical protein n=1 Tax=Streptomyces sp. NPDC059459 TaxID=3346839 RepID=UPI0036937D66